MKNKVVFITGSAKRLGANSARYLHQLGFDVVLHYHHSQQAAQALCDELNGLRPDSAKLLQADLCDVGELHNLADNAASMFGRLDVLINNASAFYPTPIGSISLDDWHSLVGSNMQAPLFLSQACSKHLTLNQGVIINMVDIHAKRPLKDHTLYCMAKAALVTMTQSLAQELAPTIRVNGVAPGAILWPESALPEAEKSAILSQIPMGKIGSPDDIAGAIAFLISAPYITGQILAVDGGRSIASTSKA